MSADMRSSAETGSAAATRLAQGMGLLPHRKLTAALTSYLNEHDIQFSRGTDAVGATTWSTSARRSMTPQQAADTFLGHLGGFDGVMDSFTEAGKRHAA